MTEPESTEDGGEPADADPDPTDVDDGQREEDGARETASDGRADVDPLADATVDEDVRQRVEALEPATLAREIATLELEVDALEAELEERDEEIDDLTSKLKRKQADFENYKKRMERRQEEELQRATEGIIERFLAVRDNLERALEQDGDVDIRDGVESTLLQFDDLLEAEDVAPIDPAPGADVDPARHEVLARVESDQPDGTVAEVHRRGYAVGESVLREAQVAVSEGDGGSADGEADADGGADDGSDDAEAAE